MRENKLLRTTQTFTDISRVKEISHKNACIVFCLYKVQEKAKLIYSAGGRRWVISVAELTGTREAPWILEMAFLDLGDVSVHICRIH